MPSRRGPLKTERVWPLPKRTSIERQLMSLPSARSCSLSTGPPRSKLRLSRSRPGL